MRNRCLFLVFFCISFCSYKRELYIPSMVNRKNQNDYEKLMDSYSDLTDAEYYLKYNDSCKTQDKKSYDLNISKRNNGRSLNECEKIQVNLLSLKVLMA